VISNRFRLITDVVICPETDMVALISILVARISLCYETKDMGTVFAFTGTYCTYPGRDGQAELAWVAG